MGKGYGGGGKGVIRSIGWENRQWTVATKGRKGFGKSYSKGKGSRFSKGWGKGYSKGKGKFRSKGKG